MPQKIDTDVSNLDVTRDRPRARAYIKQETEDSKEYLKRALYPSVKIESRSLDISKYKSTIRNKHCSICNISFLLVKSFLDHELHSHKTKEAPIIDLCTLCCNIYNRRFEKIGLYREHMAGLNNIHVPLMRSKTKDPNNHCQSCNFAFKTKKTYRTHARIVHNVPLLRYPKEQPKNTKPTINILNRYCDVSDRTFVSNGFYVHHLIRVHRINLSEPSDLDPKRRYCNVCDITFSRNNDFIVHSEKIHGVTPPSLSALLPNMNDPNNHCVKCDKTYSTRSTYLNHLISNHLDEIPELYQGIDCMSPSEGQMKSERYCADCRKLFLLKSLHRIHVIKIHGANSLEYLPSANNPNNHCTSCDKTYRQRLSYRNHLFKVHNLSTSDKSTVNSDVTPVVDRLKKYCNVCDRVYKTLSTYRQHMSRHHAIHVGLLNFVNRDEKPVIDETRKHCTACDKTYTLKRSYVHHLYSVHSIMLRKRRYKTPQINCDIIQNMDVNYFLRFIHSSRVNKDSHCALCNRTYSNVRSYRHHLATVHNRGKQKDTD